MSITQVIPQEQAAQIRRMAHDLSNALEIIVQASYLLSTVPIDENARQWVQLLDQGVRQAASTNHDLREYIRTHS